MRKNFTGILLLLFGLWAPALAQGDADKPADAAPFRRCFVGTSAFLLGNLAPQSPSFFQLNFGYWLSERHTLSLEAITWTYRHPLGIPYGKEKFAEENEYPGYVREYGLALAYQFFPWKGLYTALHIAPFRQRFLTEEGELIATGFQLFNTLRIGYHFAFAKNRLFVEPSLALTFWPVQGKVPEGFAELDEPWPSYFLPEPGLHLGYKF